MKSLLFLAPIAVALLSACGGGGSGSAPATLQSPGPQPAAVSGTTVQFNLGDAPADRLLAVATTVDRLTLTDSRGASVSVLAAPRPVEMLRLMGTVTPLALARVPQGTYSGAAMTFGTAMVTHLDPVSGEIVQRAVPGPMQAQVTFNPPLTVGTAPAVINFDMNMAASVLIDGNGNVLMTPTLGAGSNPLLPGSRNPEDGGMHGVIGSVGGVQGGSFAFSTTQGLAGLSMTTHSGTHYSGLAGTHMMGGSMLVSVDAMPQADGTWRVDHVQSRMSAGGSMAAGVVTAISGAPPTQLTVVMHDGAGNGMVNGDLGRITSVSIGSSTQFVIDAAGVDLAGLPFTPQFDRTRLGTGQVVRAWSSGQIGHHGMGGMGGGTVNATSVELEPQGLRGIVSGYVSNGAQATFTLTLPADAAFAKLAGTTAVTVYQQGSTQLRGPSALSNGSTVLVRGLLFIDGSVFRLVAGRIVAG